MLIEADGARGREAAGALNHLGIEVVAPGEVVQANMRLAEAGLETAVEQNPTCCSAAQDVVWVRDPGGAPWEVSALLADGPVGERTSGSGTCCSADSPTPEGRSSAGTNS